MNRYSKIYKKSTLAALSLLLVMAMVFELSAPVIPTAQAYFEIDEETSEVTKNRSFLGSIGATIARGARRVKTAIGSFLPALSIEVNVYDRDEDSSGSWQTISLDSGQEEGGIVLGHQTERTDDDTQGHHLTGTDWRAEGWQDEPTVVERIIVQETIPDGLIDRNELDNSLEHARIRMMAAIEDASYRSSSGDRNVFTSVSPGFGKYHRDLEIRESKLIDTTIEGTFSGLTDDHIPNSLTLETIDTDLTLGSVVFAGTDGVLAEDNSNFFWDDTNDRLGIGTSSPYAKLSVVGEAVAEYYTATSTSATSSFAGGFSVATDGLLYDFSSGNVGIATSSPYAKLSVAGETVAEYYTATSTTATSSMLGGLAVGTTDTTDAQFYVEASTTASSGGVYGIRGGLRASSSASGAVSLRGMYSSVEMDGSSNYTGTNYGGLYLINKDNTGTAATNIALAANSQLRATGALTNQIGIQGALTQNAANAYAENGYGLRLTSPNVVAGDGWTNLYGIYLGDYSTGTSTSYALYADGGNIVANEGNIGVATTSPFARLSVAGASNGTASLFSVSSSTASATSTVFHIDSNGLVGIGTSSPSALLHVNRSSPTVRIDSADNTQTLIDGNANRSGADNNILSMRGLWNDTSVAQINFRSGADTTNKDDGRIYMFTANGGTITERLSIDENGALVFNEGGESTADFRVEGDTLDHLLFVDASADNVGIATSTPWALMSINQRAGDTGLVVGSSTHTSFIVDEDRNVGIGTSTPHARLSIESSDDSRPIFFAKDTSNATASPFIIAENGEVGIGLESPTAHLDVLAEYTNVAGTRTGIKVVHDETITADTAATSRTLNARGESNVSTGVTQTGFLIGVSGTALLTGDGTATKLVAGSYESGTQNGEGTGDIIEAISLRATVANRDASGEIFTGSGVQINTPVTTGNIGDVYGLKIQDHTGAGTTSSFAISVDGGNVALNEAGTASDFRVEGDTDTHLLFADGSSDRVGIGTSSPYAKLSVVGQTVAEYFTATSTSATSTLPNLAVTNLDTAFTAGSVVFAGAGGTLAEANSNFYWDISNGRLGLGTTTPSEKLHISDGEIKITHSSDSPSFIFEDGDDSDVFHLRMQRSDDSFNIMDGSTFPGDVRMKIYKDGEVVFNDPGDSRDFRVESNGAEHALLVASSTDNVGVGTATPWGKLTVTNTGAKPSFLVEDQGADPTPFIIDQTGEVGIGTTSPDAELHIDANSPQMILQAANDAQAIFIARSQRSAASNNILQIDGEISGNKVSQIAFRRGATAGEEGRLVLLTATSSETGPVSRLFINDSGNVVINDPGYITDFRVEGDTEAHLLFADGSKDMVGITDNDPDAILEISASGGANDPFMVSATDGGDGDLFIVKNGGNVGVGSTTPHAKLSVTHTGAGPAFIVEDESSPDQSPFIIDAAGLVGIGTTTPSSRLTVQGDVCITNGASCPAEAGGRLYVDTAGTAGGDDPGDVFDLAELYPAVEIMDPADIAAVATEDSDKATIKKAVAGDALVGIISSTPAIAINGSDLTLGPAAVEPSDRPLVALAGRVPVKVNMSGGAIRKGDYVGPSTVAGVGKKAAPGDGYVGIALESYNGEAEKEGKVLVFVTTGIKSGGIDLGLEDNTVAASVNTGAFGWIAEQFASLKITVKEGFISAYDLVADTLRARRVSTEYLQMKDSETGHYWCVTIARGQWHKVPGICPEEPFEGDIPPPIEDATQPDIADLVEVPDGEVSVEEEVVEDALAEEEEIVEEVVDETTDETVEEIVEEEPVTEEEAVEEAPAEEETVEEVVDEALDEETVAEETTTEEVVEEVVTEEEAVEEAPSEEETVEEVVEEVVEEETVIEEEPVEEAAAEEEVVEEEPAATEETVSEEEAA